MLGTLLGAIVAAIGATVLAVINMRGKIREKELDLESAKQQRDEARAERDALKAKETK